MCSVRSVEESVLKVFEAVCDECDDCTRVRVVCGRLLCERVKKLCGELKNEILRKRNTCIFRERI